MQYEIGGRMKNCMVFVIALMSVNVYGSDAKSNNNPSNNDVILIRQLVADISLSLQEGTKEAVKFIQEAFKEIDMWLQKPAFNVPQADKVVNLSNAGNQMSAFLGINNTDPNNNTLKIHIAMKHIDNALIVLNGVIQDNTTMKAVSDTIGRALKAVGTESTITSDVLRNIVNSVKLAMLAPVKAAIVGTGITLGAGIGGTAGLGIGVAAGINRTGIDIHKAYNAKNSNVAITVGNMIVAGLKGVGVVLPASVAKGIAHGVGVGAVAGGLTAKYATGNVFSLSKKPVPEASGNNKSKTVSTNNNNNNNNTDALTEKRKTEGRKKFTQTIIQQNNNSKNSKGTSIRLW